MSTFAWAVTAQSPVPPVRAENVTQRRNQGCAVAFAPSPRRECKDSSDGEFSPSSSAVCLLSLSPWAGRDVCPQRWRYHGKQYFPCLPPLDKLRRCTATVSKLRIKIHLVHKVQALQMVFAKQFGGGWGLAHSCSFPPRLGDALSPDVPQQPLLHPSSTPLYPSLLRFSC